ncbi:hypothetical protein C9374_006891 [Naegleria lovaniensis]|uniref:MHD domain-containing protein n=1 Tax=Naegleria lovaniensis TaxID=51637 RepID=A0AA88H275_NAELO|nr:uncharacterized protein C9374_006891 [Naegleria lovaniensis]KAG2393360.1 hypothetical protein C9374_006891 [Naegleria lovaniensis]
MGVLSLFVQEQREPRLNLFLHSHHELSQNQAITISDHFAKQIATNTSARGEVFIAKKFRAVFILLNEVYVVTVCHKSDYPYDALRCANNAKLLMFEACKGVEVTVVNLYKKFGQIMLALEELINETNTFKPPSTSIEMVGKTKLGEAHHVSSQHNGSTSQAKANSVSTAVSPVDASQKKARRGTIRQMEKLISYTADEMWKEKQKQMEVHQKRFQILDKFKSPILTAHNIHNGEQNGENHEAEQANILPDPSDIVNFQFGYDFTAPDEEDALPSFNHRRAKSTNSSGSETNGISSFRKRQMEHITMGQQVFPLSDEEWHSLQAPTLPDNLKPIFIPPANNMATKLPPLPPSLIPLQPQPLRPQPAKTTTAFDRGDSKLISFEPFDLHGSSASSRVEGDDTEVDMSDEDVTFRSDKMTDSTTADSVYDYNPPKFNTHGSSSNLFPTQPLQPLQPMQPLQPLQPLQPTKLSQPTNNNTLSSSFLDDVFGPMTSTNTVNTAPSQNGTSLLLDNILKPTNATGTNNTFVPPPPSNVLNVNGGVNVPPVPNVTSTPTNNQPIRKQVDNKANSNAVNTDNKESNLLQDIQNKQLNPVPKMPVFDSNELKKSIEQSQQKRAAVLPFKVVVTETVVKNMCGLTEEEYNFLGQIELILFNHESYRENDSYNFVLSLVNDQFNNSENLTKIAKIVCNPKLAKEVTETENVTKHAFECNITGQEINPKTQSAILLKYKLKDHLNLVPFKLRPLYYLATKDNQTMLTITIDYIVNPITPLDKLSFLIRVAPALEQITLKSQSKPEGRWNATRQELLVNVDQAGPKGSVTAKFLLNKTVTDIGELQTEFLCKFNAKGLLGGFTVEGGESKRSIHNTVFLGGSEYNITTPSWKYKLTSENLNPQFANNK